MKLTEKEVTDAVLAAAESKALRLAALDVSDLAAVDGSAEMAAAIEQPTTTVAAVRAKRATNKQLFDTDPAGAALKFGASVGNLLGLLGLG